MAAARNYLAHSNQVNSMDCDALMDLRNLENVHYPSGPVYQCKHYRWCYLNGLRVRKADGVKRVTKPYSPTLTCKKSICNKVLGVQKIQALSLMNSNELEAIYHLSESHSPGLRCKAIFQYEKVLTSTDENKQFSLNKQHVQFSCANEAVTANIDRMLQKVQEMPEEWTLVQLTSEYYSGENMEFIKNDCTVPICISVFDCGSKPRPKPFCVRVDAPVDKISGKVMGIREEMVSILHENKYGLKGIGTVNGFFKSHFEKQRYVEMRLSLNNRLKLLVKDLQGLWLKEWRCLFVGKFFDEECVNVKLEDIVKAMEGCEITEKTRCILKCIIKASGFLSLEEIRNALAYCFPHKNISHKAIAKLIKDISHKNDLSNEKRHPVILVIDEKLDIFPWEMLDVLQNHPATRMPSLHFTYGLFKEHESTITNGMKADVNPEKGRYIINPGRDLKDMQNRMHNFFKYWKPEWTGPVGVTPSSKEFEDLLTEGDIFSYNGHGNGSQFISGEKIGKLKINAVVLLFGCGSVKNIYQGPRVEMYASYHMYLIACSPCIVGTLWEVTDRDTDILATEFWSQWLPSSASTHWKNIERAKWESSSQIIPLAKCSQCTKPPENEPELLRALCKARKAARQFLTQASCVARGIPVKLKSS